MRAYYVHQIICLLLGLYLNNVCCNPDYFDLMTQSCPFTDFCSVKSLESYNAASLNVPCCSNCSCDADCWRFNNCCPDAVYTESADLQKANCISMLVPKQPLGDNRYQHYLVIDFCPRDFEAIDQHTLDYCEERFDDNTMLNDIVAVSDGDGRIYKNRFCALCNGVRDVVSWDLVMGKCNDNFSTSTFESTNYLRNMMDNCPLESVTTKGLSHISRFMECGNTMIDSCPNSSQPELQQGCLLGPHMPYYVSPHFKRFKNVLCYLCQNFGDIHKAQHMCQAHNFQRTTVGGFSVLIDPTLSERIAEIKPSSVCSTSEVWDHIKRRCLKLFCPQFSVISNGQCLKLGHATNTVRVLRVRLEPIGQPLVLDTVQAYDNEKEKAYMNEVMTRYGIRMCEKYNFYSYIQVERKSGKLACIYNMILLFLDEHCQLEEIASAARSRLSSYQNASLIINGGRYRFTEKIDVSQFEFDQEMYRSWTLAMDVGTYTPPLKHFFICPYFMLNIQEYNSVINDVFSKNEENIKEISEFTRVENGFYTLSNSTIAVCVDTYFELYKTNRGNSNIHKFPEILLGVILVGALFLLSRVNPF